MFSLRSKQVFHLGYGRDKRTMDIQAAKPSFWWDAKIVCCLALSGVRQSCWKGGGSAGAGWTCEWARGSLQREMLTPVQIDMELTTRFG